MADQRKLCAAQSYPVEGSLIFIVLAWAGKFIIVQHFHNKHRILYHHTVGSTQLILGPVCHFVKLWQDEIHFLI